MKKALHQKKLLTGKQETGILQFSQAARKRERARLLTPWIIGRLNDKATVFCVLKIQPHNIKAKVKIYILKCSVFCQLNGLHTGDLL